MGTVPSPLPKEASTSLASIVPLEEQKSVGVFFAASLKKFRNSTKTMPKARPCGLLCGYEHIEPFPSLGSMEKGAQKGHGHKGGPEGAQGDEVMRPRHS